MVNIQQVIGYNRCTTNRFTNRLNHSPVGGCYFYNNSKKYYGYIYYMSYNVSSGYSEFIDIDNGIEKEYYL